MLRLTDICKRFDSKTVADRISLTFDGGKVAVANPTANADTDTGASTTSNTDSNWERTNDTDGNEKSVIAPVYSV